MLGQSEGDTQNGNPRGKGWLSRYRPAVHPRILVLLAGLMWIAVGLLLVYRAVEWLRAIGSPLELILALCGFVMALLIHHFGFLRIVDRNLGRLRTCDGKRCVFSFMPLKSYLMVAIMMTMGFALRHSPVPRPYLAVLYVAIGAALLLSSIRYLRALIRSS